jgi:hypothetical protein
MPGERPPKVDYLKLIRLVNKRRHLKASESYLDVEFDWPDEQSNWKGSVPIEYRRTGVSARTEAEEWSVVVAAYEAMRPSERDAWVAAQEEFWRSKPNARITKAFFDVLVAEPVWRCGKHELPANRNPARRLQDIKEFGYTLSTNTSAPCKVCDENTTQYLLLRLPRGGMSGYETWSKSLRARIVNVLGNYDSYEDSRTNRHLLPDHKFPEARWDQGTREVNPSDMPEADIKRKYQLLSNQRNQQKREACRTCVQTGRRQFPFGIRFYYEGVEFWPVSTPVSGREAEKGCVGCGWYDLGAWRAALNAELSKQ